MRIYIIIPAHNEETFIKKTIESLATQSYLPTKILIVDDHSTDRTAEIAEELAETYSFVSFLRIQSDPEHSPGHKVINAFNKGLDHLDSDFDAICKFDADLIFPPDYLKKMVISFRMNPRTGIMGGQCYIQKGEAWVLENLTRKDHLRGAIKAYKKNCFLKIGGLKPAMGWDTADELLAQYHLWDIEVDPSLKVKHLKPTGNKYHKTVGYKQGAAFYSLRYGFVITLIASLKLAWLKRNPILFLHYLQGFWNAKKEKESYLVTKKEGKFIRKLRWKKMTGNLIY